MPAKGSALKGALASAPKGRVTSLPVAPRPIPLGKPNAAAGIAAGVAQGAGLQRLSPGVYRSTQGQLVNSKGGNLPGQRQQQQRPMPSQQPSMGSFLAGVAQGANQFQPQQPMQPATRPPMPYGQGEESGMMYAGGSPNYNETTGQYNNPFQYGFGAGFGAGMDKQLFRQDIDPTLAANSQSAMQAIRRYNPSMQMFPQQQQQNMQQYQQMEQPQQQPMMPQNGFYRGNA